MTRFAKTAAKLVHRLVHLLWIVRTLREWYLGESALSVSVLGSHSPAVDPDLLPANESILDSR